MENSSYPLISSHSYPHVINDVIRYNLSSVNILVRVNKQNLIMGRKSSKISNDVKKIVVDMKLEGQKTSVIVNLIVTYTRVNHQIYLEKIFVNCWN